MSRWGACTATLGHQLVKQNGDDTFEEKVQYNFNPRQSSVEQEDITSCGEVWWRHLSDCDLLKLRGSGELMRGCGLPHHSALVLFGPEDA